jgi:hypothetical protein
MATDLIELAKEKKIAAEKRLEELQAEMKQVQQDVAEWKSFVEKYAPGKKRC